MALSLLSVYFILKMTFQWSHVTTKQSYFISPTGVPKWGTPVIPEIRRLAEESEFLIGDRS